MIKPYKAIPAATAIHMLPYIAVIPRHTATMPSQQSYIWLMALMAMFVGMSSRPTQTSRFLDSCSE